VRAIRRLLGQLPLDVSLLLLLPFLLLAVDWQWLYPEVWSRDTWIYHGYFIDLPGRLRQQVFPNEYYGCRLSYLLPGWLAYRWLPPDLATQAQHLGLYYLMVFSLFVALRGLTDRRAAGLVTVLFGTQGFVLLSAKSDFANGYVIAFYLLAVAAAVRATVSPRYRLWLFVAGAASTAVVVSNLLFVLLLPIVAGLYVVLNRTRGREPLAPAACWVALGVVVALVGFALANKAMAGRFNFLQPSFAWAGDHVKRASPARLPIHEWAARAGYLVLPLACAVGAGVALLRRSRWTPAGVYLSLACLGLVAALLASTLHPSLVLCQVYHYPTSLLLPCAVLALGLQWSGRFDSLSAPWFAALLGGCAVAGVLTHAVNSGGPAPSLALCLLVAVAGVLLPLITSRWVGVAAALLALVLTDCAVQRGYRSAMSERRHQYYGRTLDEIRHFDHGRKDYFRVIDQAMRLARAAGGRELCWYSFDRDEPLGCVFEMVCCCHGYHTALPVPVRGSMKRGLPPGRVVAVLSENPEHHRTVLAELASRHQRTGRVTSRQEVRSGSVGFWLTLLELDPVRRGETVALP
jgi:hypothetical protein